jgi:hypothetical protein
MGAGLLSTRSNFAFLLGVLLAGCASAPPPEPATSDDAEPTASPAEPAVSGHEQTVFPDRSGQLSSSVTRERVILELLEQFRSVAKNGTKTPPARAFVDRYAGDLAGAYVAGRDDLAPTTRLQLLTQLLSYDDARTAPAHIKALSVYAQTGAGVDEAILACQAAARLKLPGFAPSLMAAFDAIDMPNKDHRRLSVHLARAMQENATAVWASELALRLTPPMERPESFNDTPAVKKYQNQVYWQTTAATLLGRIGEGASARALARVLLSNEKSDLHAAAELSLVQLGEPSIDVALALLDQKDAELVALAKSARSDLAEPNIYFATEWLTRLGHPRAREALQAAWDDTHNPQSRVLIARALTSFPKSERSLEQFKQTLASSPLTLTLPAGESALESLVERSPFFFEPSLVPWLEERAGKVPGAGTRKGDVQRALVVAIAQLVTPAQITEANKASQRFGGRVGTPTFDGAAQLARKCQADAACYATELGALSEADEVQSAIAAKASIMVGVLGKVDQRKAVLERLLATTDLRLHAVLVRTLDHLTPKADQELLAVLDKAIADTSPTDPNQLARAHTLQLLTYRLRIR